MDVDVVVVPEAEPVEPAEVELSPAALDDVAEAVAEGVAEALPVAEEPAAGALLVEDIDVDTVSLPRAEYDDLLHRVTMAELALAHAAEDPGEEEPMPPPPREEPLPPEEGSEGETAKKGSRERAPGYGARAWYGGRGR